MGLIAAIAPAVAVLVAVGVALMQYYLQKQQQKQALFEKRFKVYEETLSYLVVMMNDEETMTDVRTDLLRYQQFRKGY